MGLRRLTTTRKEEKVDNQSSYQIQNISGNLETELNRLKAQVELFWEKELKRYKEFGLKDGMSVIELGCGPGFVIEKLMDAFPRVNITGMELDPFLVQYARDYLQAKNFNRCKIIGGSIMDTGLPGNSFDFAITRLVLEHLSDPVNAVREVHRILKPGGRAVFIDNDFEMHMMTSPHVPELRELYEAYCRARYAEGGNPKIGRELPTILKKGGFSNIEFEIIGAHSGILGDEKFFKSEGVGIPYKLVEAGYLPSKVLGSINVKWKKMIYDDSHAIIRQLYLSAGEKSAQMN